MKINKINILVALAILFFQLSVNAQEATFFCQNNQVFCSSSNTVFNVFCSDPSYVPTCFNNSIAAEFPGGFPDCCKKGNEKGLFLDCVNSFLVCPDSSDKFETINLNVTGGPILPDLVDIPLTLDSLNSGTDFAYVGSNPSFDVLLPRVFDLNVISVDVRDSRGIIYQDLEHKITKDLKDEKRFVVSVELPDNITIGEATLSINFGDNSTFSGLFQVIDFLPVQIPTNKKNTVLKNISKPVVSRVKIMGGKKNLRVRIKGDHFVGSKVFFPSGEVTAFQEDPENIPNTTATVLPADLNIAVRKIKVNKSGRKASVNLRLTEALPSSKIEAVLVLSTPRGIVSVPLNIKTRKTLDSTDDGAITCVNGKPRCEDGRKARCTGGYKPICFRSSPIEVPDCCIEETRGDEKIPIFNKCQPARLFCK